MTVADPILAALQEQVACYTRLAKLAEIQHEHVQNNQTDELIHVLTQRQEVLEQMKLLEKVLEPAKGRWNEYLQELQGSDRSSAEDMLAETRRLLEKITTSDRNDTMILQQRKLNLGKQIHQATSARQVNRTYGTAAYGRPESRMDLSR